MQDFKLQLDLCKDIFHKHYIVQKLPRLYNFSELKKRLDSHKNNLLNILHEALIFNSSISNFFDNKMEQRCVFLVHTLVFMKNQNLNILQKDCALWASVHHLSANGMAPLSISGHMITWRSMVQYRSSYAAENVSRNRELMKIAFDRKLSLLLEIDDIHFIHPYTNELAVQTSLARHYATLAMDQYDHPAIASSIPVHRMVQENGKVVRGGISVLDSKRQVIKVFKDYCTSSVLDTLPEKGVLGYFDFSASFDVYVESYRETKTLKKYRLLDLLLSGLHSSNDYKKVIFHIFSKYPELTEYLRLYLMFTPLDKPGFRALKGLAAQWEKQNLPEHFLSLIPFMGQFHLYLNGAELAVQQNWTFFNGLYKSIYKTQVSLPKKPKPNKVTLLLIYAFSGYLLINKILSPLLRCCKDEQASYLQHLLEEVIPINSLVYENVFQHGSQDQYNDYLSRFFMFFSVYERHHYDKLCLSTISDLIYWKENVPEVYSVFKKHRNCIDERKIELLHAAIRTAVSSLDPTKKIVESAHVISHVREGFDELLDACKLNKSVSNKKREESFTMVVRSAYYIKDLVEQILLQKGMTTWTEDERSGFKTPQFGTVQTKFMPMGYSSGRPPKSSVKCDLPSSQVTYKG